MRRGAGIFLFLLTTGTSAFAQKPFPPLSASDRIIVVAPHPDDEILGAGGLIQQACAVGAEVHIVYLTSGDHNQIAFKLYRRIRLHLSPKQYIAFGELRNKEAKAANALFGLAPDELTFLGYPDGGTLEIWRDHWGDMPPYRSDATRTNAVPYPDALSYGKSYTSESVSEDFLELFRRIKPTKIFVTHPADTNPDHRAAANFVRLAVLELGTDQPSPQIYYYLVHFGRWPFYSYHPEDELEPPHQLLDDGEWSALPLSTDQAQRKYEAILENHTQLTTRQYFLVSFARADEIFATMEPLAVPTVPADNVIDWKRALHSKTIKLPPAESGERTPAEQALIDELAAMEMEETAYVRQGDDLIAQVTLRNRLGKRANVHLMLYGYKHGVDFAAEPKLHINVTPLGSVHVFDRRKLLKEHGVKVISITNHLVIRVPLRLLGDEPPDLLFASTRSNLGEVAADDTAWHLFSLSNDSAKPHIIEH